MSKLISIKIDDDVFTTAEDFVRKTHMSRNAYINKAIQFMNQLQERRRLRKELRKESEELGFESQKVLEEFESFLDEGIG